MTDHRKEAAERAPIKIAPGLARCLLVGPWGLGFAAPSGDQLPTIISQDERGWTVVGCHPDPDESSGVWVDPEGVVHYSGPSREQTGDPWPTRLVSYDGDQEARETWATKALDAMRESPGAVIVLVPGALED